MSEKIEKVARAIEGAEVGYHLRLTSLVDGISTYTIDYDDGTPTMEFDCTDDAYAHIAHKKRLKAAYAAIEAMREPNCEMLDAAWSGIFAPPERAAEMNSEALFKHAIGQKFTAMIDAASNPVSSHVPTKED